LRYLTEVETLMTLVAFGLMMLKVLTFVIEQLAMIPESHPDYPSF